ncbi:MAG: transposase [Candidatus Ornithospirochaeta sp.]
MLAAVIYGFAQSSGTLRTLEERCRFDIRFMYILDGATPSHASLCNFMNEVVRPRYSPQSRRPQWGASHW